MANGNDRRGPENRPERQFAEDGSETIQRYAVLAPKVIVDWNTGKRNQRFFRVGNARKLPDGSITVMINSTPTGQWDGMCKLEPIEFSDSED